MFEYRIALFEFEYKCISLFVCLNSASSASDLHAAPLPELIFRTSKSGEDEIFR